MNMQDKMRALADRFNKTYAKNPMLLKGHGLREKQELLNTSAMARTQGKQRQIPKLAEGKNLAALVKNL